MAEIQLFKFSNMPDEIKKAVVVVDEKTHATKHKDAKTASEAYQKMRDRFKNWLLSDNLVVLTGAGSSITTDDEGKSLSDTKKKYTGKTVSQIWEDAKAGLDQKVIKKLQKILDEPDEGFNLERFISKLETYRSANENDDSTEMKKTVGECTTVKDAIIQKIKEECELDLHIKAPHQTFLRNVMTSRKRQQARLQLFTLNYDTLFEQAAETQSATIIDGFSFTRTPVFNAANFELDIVRRGKHRIHHEENYEEKVFNLYKLHGSLDWENTEGGKTVRRQSIVKKPLIIPPTFNKFEQSYQMPFFEMMSRFQQIIRKENTTLLIIGYSFGDNHINRVIMEALSSNLNLELVIIAPTITDESKDGATKDLHSLISSGQSNITLISDTFQRMAANMPAVIYAENLKEAEIDEILNTQDESKNGSDKIPF